MKNFKLLFPPHRVIPAEFRMDHPIRQNEYLLDGALRQWDGACQEVLSPIWENRNDVLAPFVIGTAPALSREVALEALDAAKRAYANGRGEWSTKPVGERIAAVQRFTKAMQGKRSEIIRLLIWETGKSLQEAEREFDRSVSYINETIDALKELDRSSSRFVIQRASSVRSAGRLWVWFFVWGRTIFRSMKLFRL